MASETLDTVTDQASSSRVADAPSGPRLLSDDERAARADRVWQKHLDGQLIALDEFLSRRRAV